MNKYLFSLAAFSALTAGASAQCNTWTQSTDNTTIVPGSASCLNNPAGITENSYWRLYDPIAQGEAGAYEINSVTFGVEAAITGTSGSQVITVNLRDGTGFPTGASSAPILGSDTIVVADTNNTFETLTFVPPVFVSAGTLLAVEIMAPLGQPQGDFFFIGSNTLGETPLDSSYLSAAACGIVDPTPTSAIGFPVHFIIDVESCPAGPGNIGTAYCDPNNPNSTGVPATLAASGSTAAAAQSVLLTASSMPPGQFGYFIASRTQGFIANPAGSLGNLCVVGNQARYNQPGRIFQVDAGGDGSLQVGDINVPTNTNPPGGETITAGDSWNWQAWYRDIGNTNNFTHGLNILFN